MQEDNAYSKWDGELGGESRNFQQHKKKEEIGIRIIFFNPDSKA